MNFIKVDSKQDMNNSFKFQVFNLKKLKSKPNSDNQRNLSHTLMVKLCLPWDTNVPKFEKF